jgi:hypothetical protein
MKLRDKLGWPIERVKGKPIGNFIRILIHVNLRKTLWPPSESYRRYEKMMRERGLTP